MSEAHRATLLTRGKIVNNIIGVVFLVVLIRVKLEVMSKKINKQKNRILLILGSIGIVFTPLVYQGGVLIIRAVCPQGSYGGCTFESILLSVVFVYSLTFVWLVAWLTVLIVGLVRLMAIHRLKK